jgi:hypothetical protein
MGDLIKIGSYSFKQKKERFFRKDTCGHRHLVMDDDGHYVYCEDCKIQLSAYWCLERLIKEHKENIRRLKIAWAHYHAVKDKKISLLVAQKVEKAWRSRTFVPCCPHCKRGIFPKDGFGEDEMICKKMEIARRKAEGTPILI